MWEAVGRPCSFSPQRFGDAGPFIVGGAIYGGVGVSSDSVMQVSALPGHSPSYRLCSGHICYAPILPIGYKSTYSYRSSRVSCFLSRRLLAPVAFTTSVHPSTSARSFYFFQVPRFPDALFATLCASSYSFSFAKILIFLFVSGLLKYWAVMARGGVMPRTGIPSKAH